MKFPPLHGTWPCIAVSLRGLALWDPAVCSTCPWNLAVCSCVPVGPGRASHVSPGGLALWDPAVRSRVPVSPGGQAVGPQPEPHVLQPPFFFFFTITSPHSHRDLPKEPRKLNAHTFYVHFLGLRTAGAAVRGRSTKINTVPESPGCWGVTRHRPDAHTLSWLVCQCIVQI